MTIGTAPLPTSQQLTPPTSAASPVAGLLHGAVEKPHSHQSHHNHRRSGKYTHPYGGMRQFAEDRAASSGWDRECLAIDSLESRKSARSNLADKISEMYKEEFVRVNKAEGKGRPKANNISAAKKTVRMIAERILLSLEAKATQHLFNEVIDKGKESEKELIQLRQIHKCGKENPNLSYDEIRAMASAKLNGLPETAIATSSNEPLGTSQSHDTLPLRDECEDHSYEIDAIKQSLIEMRADQILRGMSPQLLSDDWVRIVTTACKTLVRDSYSRQFVPKTRVYGCRHFTRKNRVLMVCCGTFPVCRMCHIQDPQRIHEVQIEPVHTMLCMMCGEVQPKTQNCRNCDVRFGSYYCDICGITDDTPGYDLRHCPECNVCMPGLTFHCHRCKSCVPATPEHDAVCSGANADHDVTDIDALDGSSAGACVSDTRETNRVHLGTGGGGGGVRAEGGGGGNSRNLGGSSGENHGGRNRGNGVNPVVSGSNGTEGGSVVASGAVMGRGISGNMHGVGADGVDSGLTSSVGDERTGQLFSGL